MRGYGRYNKAEAVFETAWGTHIYMRTQTDPDSVVGIPRLRAAWGDEAGKYSRYFWENIQARAASVDADILLTTSPYSRNWIYTDYVKPAEQGVGVPGVRLIRAASWENPYHSFHDPVKRQAARAKMDPRRFDMLYGGEWGQMAGLVYDCWDDDENLIDPFELPQGTRYVGGIDWGYYPDPFVMKIRAITPDGRHYGISEFVKTRLTITDIVKAAKQKCQVFPIQVFYCDPSEPAAIEEFNRNGIPAIGAVNDIRPGIDAHYELIKTRRYKEFRGACPHSMSEREMYHYPDDEDDEPDKDRKELLPVDRDNHTQDADRYISIMTYRRDGKLTPKVPGDKKNFKTRLDQLKYSYRRSSGENYGEL